MRTERIRVEVALVHAMYADASVDAAATRLLIPDYPLPPGWSAPTSPVLVLLPPGYPTTAPDNFYTDPELTLASGSAPGNSSHIDIDGERWRIFSWHLEDGGWRPHAVAERGHTLVDFLDGVGVRLQDVA